MYRLLLAFLSLLSLSLTPLRASYHPDNQSPPPIPREFRGAWVAVVYNIDWPSRSGLSTEAQKTELRQLLDTAAKTGLNAIMFQVRPAGDAVYKSPHEPWTHWLTGQAGGHPGYDPLAYAIHEGHRRGIEIHAWFNPFRAQANLKHPLGRGHLARSGKNWVKGFRESKWFDPSSAEAQAHALRVILDVVRRYDIDGVHLDDYFYPYPRVKNGRAIDAFPDDRAYRAYRAGGGTLKRGDWRRDQVNRFVSQLYRDVKKAKPWVRVGISPFGIWRPGVPRGVEASLDAYDHLFADARLWVNKGWCDYLSPQLYWRDAGPQSFSKLLGWWQAQSRSRPVWPGIASSRIDSKEDPGRPASEILRQVQISRQLSRPSQGHLHWSMKALLQNRGGLTRKLPATYRGPALPPAMPWVGRSAPARPQLSAHEKRGGCEVRFAPGRGGTGVRKWVIQVKRGGRWAVYQILQGPYSQVTLPFLAEAIAVTAVNGYGVTSPPAVLAQRH